MWHRCHTLFSFIAFENYEIIEKQISYIFIFLECTCNIAGTTKIDNTSCTEKVDCCNEDGTCTCKPGYTGKECENCNTDNGYILSDVINGEKLCERELQAYYVSEFIIKASGLIFVAFFWI